MISQYTILYIGLIGICSCDNMVNFSDYPMEDKTILEGDSLTFTCEATRISDEERLSVIWYLDLSDGSDETLIASDETLSDGTMATVGSDYRSPLTLSNINRVWNGSTVHCAANPDTIVNQPEPFPVISVRFPPSITPSITNETAIEGTSFTTPLTITGDPFPVSSNIVITRDGVSVQDGRITVNIGSGIGTSSFTMENVNRTDSGSYTVNVTTTAGSDTAVVNLDVYYVPEFAVHSKVQNVVFTEVFTFNCTPSAANPPPSSYMFERDGVEITKGVSGSILTVSSLKRSEDSRNYTCMVTNKAGSVTIATYLNILASPSAPLNIIFEDVSPFSANISWIPPSDNGGTGQPLNYSITITNNTVTLSFTTSDVTTLSLTNLQHSTQYGVEIVAENEYGVSPPAASTFTTPDSVPIIESVSVEALSLTVLSVDVVLLTDGGQNVDNYTVEISRENYSFNLTFLSAHLRSYSVMLVDILTIGETYNINMSAMNSVGESTPFQLELSVTHLPSNSDHVSEDTTLAIIGAIVGVIVIVLLLILMILIIVLCYLRWRKNEMKKDNDDVHFTTESEQKPIESIAIHDQPTESNGNSNSDNQLNEAKRTKPVESMYADVIRDRKSDTTREGILYADLKFPEEDQRRRKPPVEIQPVIYTEVQKVFTPFN